MKDKTCVVIAHHLTTIQRADVIFVVKDFQLVERGTHAELLAAGGLYAELYGLQFGTVDESSSDR
jgi:subfamily B ATP-binding cassette protein MsbA